MDSRLILIAIAVLVIAMVPVNAMADNARMLCPDSLLPDAVHGQNEIHACLCHDVLFHPLETIPSTIPSRAPPV